LDAKENGLMGKNYAIVLCLLAKDALSRPQADAFVYLSFIARKKQPEKKKALITINGLRFYPE
jgi:hypothetical protein